ncbi:MAG: hypothetical protein HY738_09015 [Bacteroidia bacterium]|nr:hypothetical protein [Bacteroidia bacterium]
MTKTELELLIEQKIIEFFGDPDAGLQLKDEFVKKLKERIKNNSQRIPHKKIIEKYV